MEWRIRKIFRHEWKDILKIYKGFVLSNGGGHVMDDVLLYFIEISVRFGERLNELFASGFLEIGCGMGIPSLTLARLGRTNVRAYDVDPKVIICAQQLRKELACDIEIGCLDVFNEKPALGSNDVLIAEKPASYKKNPREVEYSIANRCKVERHDLGMILSFLPDDTISTYDEICNNHYKKLCQAGFKVENERICEKLPFRWLIAEQRTKSAQELMHSL
jgi:hypothetical protein